jgi:predicted DNA-binding protein (UPF0251 family)
MATALAPMQPYEPPAPQKVQTVFTVELPEALAVSLQEWFERARDGGNINTFFAEVAALPIIDFRAASMPASEEAPRSLGKEKMNPAKKEEFFEVYDEGECNSAVLAERFGISQTTVRRLLKEREDATGIARPKKHFLDEQQVQEIVRLSHVEGVGCDELAARFSVCKERIWQILRSHRNEAACAG